MSAVGVLRNMTSGRVDVVSTRWTYPQGSRAAQSSSSSTAGSVWLRSGTLRFGVDNSDFDR